VLASAKYFKMKFSTAKAIIKKYKAESSGDMVINKKVEIQNQTNPNQHKI
jgi:hypothetical protein